MPSPTPAGRPARIIALSDTIQPNQHRLNSDACIIGRADICHIIVSLESISRLHAVIETDGLQYLLHDSNSANGTFVNGQQIYGPYILKDQDEIGLAAATPLIRFEFTSQKFS